MKKVFKAFLVLYLILLSLMFIGIACIPFIEKSKLDYIVNTLFVSPYKWITLLTAVLLTIINVRSIVELLSRNSSKFKIVKYTKNGEINISNETIKSMALKSIADISGIKDTSVLIKPQRERVNILVKAYVLAETNIPSVISEIQEKIRTYVETMAEINVGVINVDVMDVAAGGKLRLE